MVEEQKDVALSGSDMEPPLAERRGLLEAQIAAFKRTGYGCFLEAEAAAVQSCMDKKEAEGLKRFVASKRETARNAYASARRLQDLLDQLPEPKPERLEEEREWNC